MRGVSDSDWTDKIRDANEGDVPAIVALYADDSLGQAREQAVEPLPACYWTAFEAIRTDPRHRLVVIDDGDIAATLQLSFVPHLVRMGTERAQIEAVRVARDRRGSGLGRALLEWAIHEARRRGCGLIQLTTDVTRPDAHHVYEALGFRPTHIGMKLALAPAVPGEV
jgi:GNAT superfamily N-acetyltransferase